MIIDMHGHVVAPPDLYAFKASLVSHRGYHTGLEAQMSDADVEKYVQQHLKQLDEVGTEIQFVSPRPFQAMHSEKPAVIVHRWTRAVNDVIARQTKMHPDRLRGMGSLPQVSGEPVSVVFDEIDRCMKDLGFMGVLINPDPGEGDEKTPPMGDQYWYPLYEKLEKMDVPALVHSAACKSIRESYSNHFITEESRAILSLVDTGTMHKFPKLKLIMSHGGGSIPYQIGRWRANHFRNHGYDHGTFDDELRTLYFDTCMYNQEGLELLFRIAGPDRCVFGTERPGTGSMKDQNGKWLDDVRPYIEGIPWLSAADKKAIMDDNIRRIFTRFKVN